MSDADPQLFFKSTRDRVMMAEQIAAAAAAQVRPAPNSTPGAVGEVIAINPSGGAAFILPAGGTWMYQATPFITITNILAGDMIAGVGVGGATVGPANALARWKGVAQRVT